MSGTLIDAAKHTTLAPDFQLESTSASPVHLRTFLESSAVVLVFYRGHWCPYCRRYLAKLQEHIQRIESPGVRLLAISLEPLATSQSLARDLALSFPLLSDPTGDVIRAYGVRNTFAGAASLLPHPAVFIIDSQGEIRFRSIDRNFKKRTTVRTILSELARLRM